LRKVALISESVSEFVKCAASIREDWFGDDDCWGPLFRGQQRASWGLSPKLYRDFGDYKYLKKYEVEDEIREEFAARAPILSESRTAADPWEWYFLMQHFGAPTRLLDWTEGALIALYFAVRDHPGLYDAAVWVLDPFRLNGRAINREEIYAPSESGLPARDLRRVAPWLPERFGRRSRIPAKPIAVYPIHTVRRISTQRSSFTLHGADPAGLDKLEGGRCLVKIVIPSFRVSIIRRDLETAGIDEATIFPDLDGLGRTVCARWRVNKLAPPHANVHTRLRPSGIHEGGIGVFAICKIRKGTRLFLGDNEEMVWIEKDAFCRESKQNRKLYEDFAVVRNERYGCPQSFNRLTMAWYMNEPMSGKRANVACEKETYDFVALREIQEGEELTVNYSTFSEAHSIASKSVTSARAVRDSLRVDKVANSAILKPAARKGTFRKT
jgi:FRG domain